MGSGDIEMKNSEMQGMQARNNLKKLFRKLFTSYLKVCMGVNHRDFNIANRSLNHAVQVVQVVRCSHGNNG